MGFNDNEFQYSPRVIIYTWRGVSNSAAARGAKRARNAESHRGGFWQMVQNRLLAVSYITIDHLVVKKKKINK